MGTWGLKQSASEASGRRLWEGATESIGFVLSPSFRSLVIYLSVMRRHLNIALFFFKDNDVEGNVWAYTYVRQGI